MSNVMSIDAAETEMSDLHQSIDETNNAIEDFEHEFNALVIVEDPTPDGVRCVGITYYSFDSEVFPRIQSIENRIMKILHTSKRAPRDCQDDVIVEDYISPNTYGQVFDIPINLYVTEDDEDFIRFVLDYERKYRHV